MREEGISKATVSADEGARFNRLCSDACSIIDAGRKHAYQAVNTVMVYSYYELGRRIVEEEQGGEVRAEYGKQIIVRLSKALTRRYKRGFSVTNLKQMRSFFLLYSRDEIGQTVSDQFANLPKTQEGRAFPLSWSHYLKLMRIEDENERQSRLSCALCRVLPKAIPTARSAGGRLSCSLPSTSGSAA